MSCSTAKQAEPSEDARPLASRGGFFYLLPEASPPTRLTLTEAFRGPVAPLGAAGLPVVAGEDGTTRQHKALVADVLHGGPHRKFGARYEASAVLHVPGVVARSHYG